MFLAGESQGQRSLVGCRPRGRTESDTTEVTWRQQQQELRNVCAHPIPVHLVIAVSHCSKAHAHSVGDPALREAAWGAGDLAPIPTLLPEGCAISSECLNLPEP